MNDNDDNNEEKPLKQLMEEQWNRPLVDVHHRLRWYRQGNELIPRQGELFK